MVTITEVLSPDIGRAKIQFSPDFVPATTLLLILIDTLLAKVECTVEVINPAKGFWTSAR